MQQHELDSGREQVSLVNLTMALGIAVEFCAHPAHAFMEASGERPARTAAALRSAGASVLCGIALTKLIGALSRPIQLCLHVSKRGQRASLLLISQAPSLSATVC